MKNKLNKILSKNPDFVFYDHENECVGDDLLNLVSKLLKEQELVIADKNYDLGVSHYKQECQKLQDEQHERANDHYASLIADIHSKLKKIQILADQEQALQTDIALNNLLQEIKK